MRGGPGEGQGTEGRGGPKVSQSSVVGTACSYGDHVEVLTPKLLCSCLLL